MNPISSFTTIEMATPYRLRGPGNQQNNTALLWQPPSYRVNQAGGSPSTTTLRQPGVSLGFFALHNRSGTTGVHGLGVRIPNHLWIAGQWDDDGATPFSDDTIDAQDEGATDFALETTTANDGYVIASRVLFNAISIDIGTASVGVPVRALRYTNTAGSGWTTFANLLIQDGAAAVYPLTGTTAANESLVVWNPPQDWGKTQTAGLSGIPREYYAVNMRATTASTTAGVADALSIYRLFFLTEGVADNGTLSQDFGAKDVVMAVDPVEGVYGDALVALFETANAGNIVRALVRGV